MSRFSKLLNWLIVFESDFFVEIAFKNCEKCEKRGQKIFFPRMFSFKLFKKTQLMAILKMSLRMQKINEERDPQMSTSTSNWQSSFVGFFVLNWSFKKKFTAFNFDDHFISLNVYWIKSSRQTNRKTRLIFSFNIEHLLCNCILYFINLS